MNNSMRYFDLVEALDQSGCAVCNLVLRDVDRYLDSLLYEYVNREETHHAFRIGRGLCSLHGMQVAQAKGGALGVAILFNAALDEVQQVGATSSPAQLSSLARLRGRNSAALLADALEPAGSCPVCEHLTRSEASYIAIMAEHIADAQIQSAYRHSSGLCLPHVRMVLRQISNPSRAELFAHLQYEIWRRLRDELELFIRKSNVRANIGPVGEEGDSWRRAITALAGEAGVFGLRR